MKNLAIFLLILLSQILNSCSSAETEEENNKLIIGTSADNPPYEFINEGEITGFDIDLAKEIAKELDKELVIKNIDFPGLLPALLSKNVDFIIAALTVTPKRLENVDFSEPYTSTKVAILYSKENKITEETDLSELVIGAQFGTTWEIFAKSLIKDPLKGNLKALANNLTLVQELLNKNIDIVILEDLQVSKFKANYPELDSLILDSITTDFAIALPKDSKLTPKVDEVIRKLKAEGFIDKLKQKWLAN